MNISSDLETKIQETRALIESHQKAITARSSPSLVASLRSLEKRLERLLADRPAEAGVQASGRLGTD